ncbi:hypothetical protein [Heyndrickxia camelliae]|uniref:Uncharacterized protein n=1 Tax=Heyndrickxia camelliae TaxID=1707093 RepID=A0A2N3LCU9_9BACI|nr:hypothetical protein [Heyndrickxia camelliae]PKR82395.1 hypothetical protein CWO92_24720 [Heyndrickxia camelliae]
MTADKLDMVLKLTKQMDFPKAFEYTQMIKEFGDTERLVSYSTEGMLGDVNGFLTYDKADKLNFDFDNLDEEISRLIDSGVFSKGTHVYKIFDDLIVKIIY